MKPSSLRRPASIILTSAAIVWIALMIYEAIHEDGLSIVPHHPGALLVSFLLCAVGTFHNGIVFRMLLFRRNSLPVSVLEVFRLFFVGQVVRYLPGRFWGVVYQYNSSRELIGAGTLLRANIDLMVLNTLYSIGVSVALLTSAGSFRVVSSVPVLLCLITTFLLFRYDYLSPLLRTAIRIIKGSSRIEMAIKDMKPGRLGFGDCLKLSAVNVSGWLFYITAWVFLLKAWDTFRGLDALSLCAFYTLSWLAGYFSMITPGGLGIREIVFLKSAGASVEQGALILVTVMARIWLMAADVFLFLLFVASGRRRPG